AYLESGFNTLAASVREDIERERAKVKAQDVTRFMYTTAFFMQALLLLVNHQDGITPQLALMEQPFAATVAVSEPTADTFGFELVGSMVNLPAFALVVRSLRTFYEEKRWAEMHTSVRCFLHLLKTLIRMSNSATEAHREVADHMFQNLCYEAATLDLLGTLVRQGDSHAYDQTYLGDLVELMHLFLRVLEHYAQEKQHMFVRKKQRVPRFAKPPGEDSNESIPQGATHSDADASDAAASGEDSSARYAFVEREFELAQCERDLARESVIKTYNTLLKQYRELPSMAVYWIVTMFQRLAIKQGFEGLFFKLSTLELFHNILTDQQRLKVYAQVDRELSAQAGLVPWDLGASTTTAGPRQVSPWTALCEFIEYIVKQFFAHLSTEPILFMEVLFSRTRLECLRPDLQQATKSKTSRPSATSAVASGSEEASDDFDNLMATRQFDFTALHCHEEEHGELTVSSHLPWSHKLGAVIGILLYRQLGATVQWVKQALAEAKAQRDQQVPNEPSSLAPLATIPDYVLPRSSVHYNALKHHPQLAELLRLVGFHYIPSIEPSDQPDDGVSTGTWALITAVPVAGLDLNIRTIDEHLTGPLGPDGTPLPRARPSKANKKKAPRRVRRRPDATSSGSDGKDDTPQARKTRLSRPRKGKTKRQLSSRAQSGQASDDKPGGGDTEPVSRMETSQALWSNNRSKASPSLARKVSALALSTSPDTSEVEAALDSSEDPLSSDGETTAQPRRPSPPIDSQSLAASNPIPNHSADMPTLSPPTKRIRRLKNRHFQENDTIWSSSPRDAPPSDPDALLANSHRLTDAGYSLPQTDWVPTSAAVDGAGSLPQSAPSDDRNSEIDPDEAIDGLDTKAAPTISVARARNVYQSRRRTMGIVSDSE
ncbi:Topoisomerase 1-associated factor 1, partial [Dimargaris xerosporica]